MYSTDVGQHIVSFAGDMPSNLPLYQLHREPILSAPSSIAMVDTDGV